MRGIDMVHLTRATRLSLIGLLVGILGLLIQWGADPSKFADAQGQLSIPFPPGIVFILACAALMLVTRRWWWHPLFAVLIAVWIVGAGTLAGKLLPNLVSPNPGTV